MFCLEKEVLIKKKGYFFLPVGAGAPALGRLAPYLERR